MIAVLIVFGLVAVGLIVGLIATARAPMGYEDEAGFHFGREGAAPEAEYSYRVPQPKLA